MNIVGELLQCDITRLQRRFEDGIKYTGIDRVNLNYAKWVMRAGGGLSVRRGRRVEVVSQSFAEALLAGTPVGKRISESRSLAAARLSAIQTKLSQFFKLQAPPPPGSIIVNPSHAWLENPEIWKWMATRGNRVISFIHDLIPIEYPEYARPIEKSRHQKRMNNALRNSHGIAVNSHCTEKSLLQYAKEEKLDVPPIAVAPLGHTLEMGVSMPPEGVKAPYFLLLGTIEPRKNHLILLTVWRELARRFGMATPMLVVVGRRGWECEQAIDLLDRCEAIHPYVREFNQATDAFVSTLIRGACALVMPSFAEGFGMPVQEALAVGTPVIASPLPTFFEIAGQIPEYVEPFDGGRWLELIIEYANPNSNLRKGQKERIKGFKESTWEHHFEKFGGFLSSLKE